MFKLIKRKDNKCRYEINEISQLMTKLNALNNISNNDYYIINNFAEIEDVNYDRHADIINIRTRKGMIISITNRLVEKENHSNGFGDYQDVLLVESLVDTTTIVPIINATKTKGVKFEIGEYLNDVFDDLKENTLRLERELKAHNNNIRLKKEYGIK